MTPTQLLRYGLLAILVIVGVALGVSRYERGQQTKVARHAEATIVTRQKDRDRDCEARRKNDSALAFTAGRRYEISLLLDSLLQHDKMVPGAPVHMPAHPPRE